MFTLWDRLKHKKFKTSTLLDMLLLAILTLGFLFWSVAFAYELPDRFRKFTSPSIDVYYQSSSCSISTSGLWKRASEKWGVVETVNRGELNNVSYDGRPTIYCATVDPNAIVSLPPGVELTISYLMSEDNNLVMASAHQYWKSGAMVDCDIRLHPVFVNDDNVDTSVLHEAGHCLGIAHSDNPDATMYFAAPDDTLHADDLLAICELYNTCVQWDEDFNMLIEPFEYQGTCFYGYMPAGKEWPIESEITECD